MTLPKRAVPPHEDLRSLAEAALSNAGDLLADARLLADAGRFPRAHALATLACEELGKEQDCLHAMWALSAEKNFWAGFTNHAEKLVTAQVHVILESSDPIRSVNLFNERVRQGSRFAHRSKLRGLYVDYADGSLQLPSDITEHETRRLIDSAQSMIDRSKTSWDARLRQAEWWSRMPKFGRIIWILFLGWAVETYPDLMLAAVRDNWSTGSLGEALGNLLRQFEEHIHASGGWIAFVHSLSTEECKACSASEAPSNSSAL